jgi:hypothetical protein
LIQTLVQIEKYGVWANMCRIITLAIFPFFLDITPPSAILVREEGTMQLEKPTSIWLGGIYGLLIGLLTVGIIDRIRPERIHMHLTTSGLLAVITASALLGNYIIEKLIHYNDEAWHRPVWIVWVAFASTFPMMIIILSMMLLFSFSF